MISHHPKNSLIRIFWPLTTSSFSSLVTCCFKLHAPAILICLEPLFPPTDTNAGVCCFTVLFCYWYLGMSFSPILLILPNSSSSSKTQFAYQLLQEAHSSTIFLYTDYVVTSLIHAMTHFCSCRYCFTLYPFVYLSFYFTRLYFWREVIIFYLWSSKAKCLAHGTHVTNIFKKKEGIV